MPIARRLLILFALSPSLAAAATSFGAVYEQSRWESRREGTACVLSHPIPRFGLALFTQDAHGELALTILAERPPSEEGRAQLHSRTPEWKPRAEQQLDTARLNADGKLLRFSHYNAQRILAELEQGQEAVMRFDGWWRQGVTELVLSPVRFRSALASHYTCLAQLPQPAATAAAEVATALRRYHPVNAGQPDTAQTGAGAHAFPAVGAAPAEATAVFFSSDDAGLDLLAMDTLRRFAARLRTEPGTTAVLSAGHADPRGTPEYNRRLAERRAASVREYLLELGVASDRVRVSSLGEEALVNRGTDSYGLAENRRVTLAITR